MATSIDKENLHTVCITLHSHPSLSLCVCVWKEYGEKDMGASFRQNQIQTHSQQITAKCYRKAWRAGNLIFQSEGKVSPGLLTQLAYFSVLATGEGPLGLNINRRVAQIKANEPLKTRP